MASPTRHEKTPPALDPILSGKEDQSTKPPTSTLPLSKLLASNLTRPIILDGALATYLETLGADISSSLWSAQLLESNPALIRKAHTDYFLAGANVAITASYQASLTGLLQNLDWASAGIEDAAQREAHAKHLIQRSVVAAHDARRAAEAHAAAATTTTTTPGEQRPLLVAGSVGPYGAFLADGSEYRGDYGRALGVEALKAFHRARIQALVAAGVDVLACETVPSFVEARALVELLRDEFPGVESWFAFTLRDGARISDGTPLEEVARLVEGEEGVVAVGVNCVAEDVALGALRVLQGVTRKPLVVYPNSGERWNAEARGWEGERTTGGLLAERAREWWGAGARLIGGCCRTTPEDIKVIKDAFRE